MVNLISTITLLVICASLDYNSSSTSKKLSCLIITEKLMYFLMSAWPKLCDDDDI